MDGCTKQQNTCDANLFAIVAFLCAQNNCPDTGNKRRNPFFACEIQAFVPCAQRIGHMLGRAHQLDVAVWRNHIQTTRRWHACVWSSMQHAITGYKKNNDDATETQWCWGKINGKDTAPWKGHVKLNDIAMIIQYCNNYNWDHQSRKFT